MADFAEALKARALADPDVSSLIGAEIHWVNVPQGRSTPYVRFQIISDPRPEHLGGYNGARVTRVQADCFAAQWGLARKIAGALITAFAVPDTVNGVQFGRIKAEGPRDFGEDTPDGFIHRSSIDLLVEHKLA